MEVRNEFYFLQIRENPGRSHGDSLPFARERSLRPYKNDAAFRPQGNVAQKAAGSFFPAAFICSIGNFVSIEQKHSVGSHCGGTKQPASGCG